jgi:hypothetical protein
MNTCLQIGHGFLGLIFEVWGVTVASGDEAGAEQRQRMNADSAFSSPTRS